MTPDELEILARGHQAEIFRYVRFLGGDAYLAEEVVQETLLAAFNGSARDEIAGWEPRRQAAWLRGTARNQFLLHHRKAARRKERPDSDLVARVMDEREAVWQEGFLGAASADTVAGALPGGKDHDAPFVLGNPGGADGGDGFEYLEALRGCLQKLTPRQRDVVEGFYGRNESREDVGKRVGMTVDGVKTLLRRVRAALAECVRDKLVAQGVIEGDTHVRR